MAGEKERFTTRIGNKQQEQVLVDVLDELQRTQISLFDYPTQVIKYPETSRYYLEERVPQRRPRLFRRAWGRIAIGLVKESFTVYQPRWLVPLEEELSAVSSMLLPGPTVTTEFVTARRDVNGNVKTGGPIPELRVELAEARQQYWIAKLEMVTSEKDQVSPPQS